MVEHMGVKEDMHNGDFANYFADIFAVEVQYGKRE